MYLPSPGFLNPGPIQPWAGMGQNILIKRVQKFVMYEVVFMEQLPMSSPFIVDFASLNGGSIGANTTVAAQSLQTPEEMDGTEFGQWRCLFLEDFNLQFYETQNLPRFLAKNARGRWGKKMQKLDPYQAMTEHGVFQDEYPFVDVINNRDYALTTARIALYGFRYRVTRKKVPGANGQIAQLAPMDTIEEVDRLKLPYVAVMAEGFIGTGFERGGLGIS